MKEKPSNTIIHSATMKCLLIMSLFLFATVFSNPAQADDDDWKFAFGLYGLYGNIGGEEANGSEIDIGADDLIDDLNFGITGALGAYKGKWGFMVDLIYVAVEDDSSSEISTGTDTLSVNTNVELTNWIVTPLLGYKAVQSDSVNMHIVGGARYLSLDADVAIYANTAARPLLARVSDSGSVWDGIVGVKGELSLNERWYIPFYLDIGTGESDFTWQANAGLGYRFEVCEDVLSYRYLSWDFDDNPALDNMNISGPMLGIKFKF